MTALTTDRPTRWRSGDTIQDPLAAGAVIHAGALVALDAAGNLVSGSTSIGLTARGRAEEGADNSRGNAGDARIAVRRGVFQWENEPTDPIDRTHIGATAYIVDDQTVAATDGAGTRSPAGRIIDLDADGVWVETL